MEKELLGEEGGKWGGNLLGSEENGEVTFREELKWGDNFWGGREMRR